MSKNRIFFSIFARGTDASNLGDRLKRICLSPTFQLFAFFAGISLFRVYSLEMASRNILDCAGCLSSQSLIFEMQFLLLAATVHFIGRLHSHSALKLVTRLLVCSMLVLYIVDLVVLQHFHVRLTMHEVLKFSGEYASIKSFFVQTLTGSPSIGMLATAAVIVLGITFLRYLGDKQLARRSPVFALLASSGVVMAGYAEPVSYHLYYLQNPIQAFFESTSRNTPYSPEFKKNVLASTRTDTTCTQSMGARPNIILVVVESLSMYHSELFSGIHNWTPQFDEISQNGRRFSNFVANGVTTEQGLISLLTGEPPIEKGSNSAETIFQQFNHSNNTVPRMLGAMEYQTAFLTTGNLGFLGKGAWLSDIGFSFIEGHDAHYYDGMKRFQFDAAPDDALYGRSLEKITQLHDSSKKPFFMMLETVTTHAPYIDPASGSTSQELVFRYADHALGEYINALEDRGFFDNGYVMIMGDHRAMTPASPDEMTTLGDRAYARLPFSIIGKQTPGSIETESFSQTDLLPSLRHWLGAGTACVGSDQGVFLPTAISTPECIFTRRSYAQNNVYAQCGTSDHSILLDGDESRFTGDNPGTASLLQEVHSLRLNQGFLKSAGSATTTPQDKNKRVTAIVQGSAYQW